MGTAQALHKRECVKGECASGTGLCKWDYYAERDCVRKLECASGECASVSASKRTRLHTGKSSKSTNRPPKLFGALRRCEGSTFGRGARMAPGRGRPQAGGQQAEQGALGRTSWLKGTPARVARQPAGPPGPAGHCQWHWQPVALTEWQALATPGPE